MNQTWAFRVSRSQWLIHLAWLIRIWKIDWFWASKAWTRSLLKPHRWRSFSPYKVRPPKPFIAIYSLVDYGLWMFFGGMTIQIIHSYTILDYTRLYYILSYTILSYPILSYLILYYPILNYTVHGVSQTQLLPVLCFFIAGHPDPETPRRPERRWNTPASASAILKANIYIYIIHIYIWGKYGSENWVYPKF